jgi:hypothetical protein
MIGFEVRFEVIESDCVIVMYDGEVSDTVEGIAVELEVWIAHVGILPDHAHDFEQLESAPKV